MPSKAAVDRIIEALDRQRIDCLLTVPAAGLHGLYSSFESSAQLVYATREEEAVALACGLVLGGRRPIVVMQQTGVGNAINAVLSLADAYELAFPILVADRTAQDPNPVQRVSSTGTRQALGGLGFVEIDWEASSAIDRFEAHVAGGVRWIVSPMVGAG